MNLYSNVTQKTYTSARDYMVNAYARNVLYYNADTKEQAQKRRKGKGKYVGLIIATATALTGIAATLLTANKKFNASKIATLGEQVRDIHIKRKIENVASNVVNIKDDYWEKFADKAKDVTIFKKRPFAFISKIGDKMRSFYEKMVRGTFFKNWDKKQAIISQLAKKEGVEVDIPKFDTWYNSLKGNIFDILHQKDNHVTDGLINKNVVKRLMQSNIADTKITDIAQEAMSEINIPKNASERLASEIKAFNALKTKTAKTIIPKIRDIESGSAATDLLTQVVSIGSLGFVVANTDKKEERKSLIINLGIPLVTALATTSIATMRALSGSTALAFGLILGQIASRGAKLITKSTNNKTSKNE